MSHQIIDQENSLVDAKTQRSLARDMYIERRDSSTEILRRKSEHIFNHNANLKYSDSQKQTQYRDLKNRVEELDKVLSKRDSSLNKSQDTYRTTTVKLQYSSAKVTKNKTEISELEQTIGASTVTPHQNAKLNQLNQTVHNFESEISSMAAEITSKKQYVVNMSRSPRHKPVVQSSHFHPKPLYMQQNQHASNPYRAHAAEQVKARPLYLGGNSGEVQGGDGGQMGAQVGERKVVACPPVSVYTPPEDHAHDSDEFDNDDFNYTQVVQDFERTNNIK